jgi:arylsulfatase A-like enzyme
VREDAFVRMRVMRGATLVVASTVGLATVDLLVQVGFLQRLAEGDWFVGWRSLLGQLLAELQVAALCTAAAACAAAAARRVLPGRSLFEATLAASAAGLGALGVMIHSGVVWGAAAGALAWPALHLALGHRAGRSWGLRASIAAVTLPLLGIALANHAVISASHARWPGAFCLALGAALALGGGAAALRRPRAWMRPLAWAPPAAALLLALLLATGGLARGSMSALATPPPAPGRPDIALIVLDTLRADHLRRFGYARDTMPALERFARDAFVATGAISTSGWTRPAHASIFSGRTVSDHGVHYSYDAESSGSLWTRPVGGIAWLPEKLAGYGYRTHAVSANELAIPEEVAFHYTVSPRFVEWTRSAGGFVDAHLPWDLPGDEWLRWRMPFVEGDRIVELVRETVPDDARPLFLFVNLLDAHAPYNPPAAALVALGLHGRPVLDRYATAWELQARWLALPEDKVARVTDLYDGGLRALDGHLDRLLDWMGEHLGPDALVILTSDHGELLGENDLIGHDVGLALALIHVPLLVRGGGFGPGQLDGPVSLRHVYELVERTAAGAGVDLAALRERDEIGSVSERYPRNYPSERGRTWVSIVDDGYQAVGPSADGLELVKLLSDGHDADPAVTRRLADRVDRYWDAHRDRREEPVEPETLDADERARLRALGYGQ